MMFIVFRQWKVYGVILSELGDEQILICNYFVDEVVVTYEYFAGQEMCKPLILLLLVF